MAFDFLVPIDDKILAHCELLPAQALGNKIHKRTTKQGRSTFYVPSIQK